MCKIYSANPVITVDPTKAFKTTCATSITTWLKYIAFQYMIAVGKGLGISLCELTSMDFSGKTDFDSVYIRGNISISKYIFYCQAGLNISNKPLA